MRRLAALQTGRRTAWFCLLIALAAIGTFFALVPMSSNAGYPASGLPASAESQRVATIQARFPNAGDTNAVVVWSRPDAAPLTTEQLAAVTRRVTAVRALSTQPEAVRPIVAKDRTAVLAAVPVAAKPTSAGIEAQATAMRAAARTELPDGVRAQLTGALGFQNDTANAFSGADVRLLLTTAGIVALLLILTYRSPVLWLIPLVVIAIADGVARFAVSAIGSALDIPLDQSILGILSVLVFGAGTDYALLLIARYREELSLQADPRQAMRIAIGGAGPAILASAGTVALSLLALLLGQLAGNRALGVACAIGIVIAAAFALLVLPAALVVFGRRVFWPRVPRFDPTAGRAPKRTFWGGVAVRVARRPVAFGLVVLVIVGGLAFGLVGSRVGLSQTQQLIGDPESVRAEAVLDRAFGPGSGARTVVLAPTAQVAAATRIARDTGGVDAVQPGASAVGYTELDLSLAGAPASDRNTATIRDLRARFASAATDGTLVGGTDATALDTRDAAAADRDLLIPIILAIVFVILVLLLRAVVAPLLLIATVVASYFASLGAGNLLFQHVLGYPAFDTSVILFGFLFLVALGVDYNIFLTTRALQERAGSDARTGMQTALAATGGVITSAGVVLAAVFVVLGVLPVVALAQIGTVVCIGVLLDTLLVRTVLVPALAFVTGEAFWWPSRHAGSAGSSAVAAPAVPGAEDRTGQRLTGV